MARTEALDTIAHNVANVNTTGFRAIHNIFSAVLASTGDSSLSVLNQDANDYGVLSGTRLDNTQGSLMPTGNALDLAVEGAGYFTVQTANGVAYTRAGNFLVSPQGQLTTAAGDPVLGENGPIMIVGQPVSISTDGTISANGAIAGRLKIAEFAPATQIQSTGGTYYTVPAGTAVAISKSQVRQGMLEGSNVNPITSAVELITAQREVETMRRVLSVYSSELDKTAAQDLPRIS
jgi:flagellar basal-body rod protein FlgF/flagellar basal-body rod protein FlgG